MDFLNTNTTSDTPVSAQGSQKIEQLDISTQVSGEVLRLIIRTAERLKDQGRGVLTELDLLMGVIESHAEIDSLLTSTDKSELYGKATKLFGDNFSVKFNGRVVCCPQAKEGLILAAIKKMTGQFSDIELLGTLFSLPRIVDLAKDSTALQTVFENQKQTNVSIQVAQSLSCRAIAYTVEDNSLQLFSQNNEQIARSLTTQGQVGTFFLGKQGAELMKAALCAVESMKRNLPDFKFYKSLSLDLKTMMDSGGDVGEETRRLLEDIRVNSPTILIATNFDRTGAEWLTALALIREIHELTEAKILVLCDSDFFKMTVGNSTDARDYGVIKTGDLDQAEVVKIIGNKLTEISSGGVASEVGLSEKIYDTAKKYLTSESFPGKALKLIDELLAEAKIRGMKTITEDLLLRVVSQKTGVPIEKLTQSDKDILISLEDKLKARVAGQDQAISAVSGAIKRAKSGLKDPKKPIGTFLFLGPTGVGKTELAKAIHDVFFGVDKSFLRLDMSEFSESHIAMRLTGSPPGYVGYEEGGQLTNFVAENPYSLILFDEIEKAHPKVYDLFLQILDEGRLTDSKGNLVDFKNTIIIFTSNIAAEEIFDKLTSNPEYDRNKLFEEQVLPKLKQVFRLEFINRFDSQIIFNPLSKEVFGLIVQMKLKGLVKLLADRGIGLEVTNEGLSAFVEKNADVKFGARSIERAIKTDIETPISEMIITNKVAPGQTLVWGANNIFVKNASS